MRPKRAMVEDPSRWGDLKDALWNDVWDGRRPSPYTGQMLNPLIIVQQVDERTAVVVNAPTCKDVE